MVKKHDFCLTSTHLSYLHFHSNLKWYNQIKVYFFVSLFMSFVFFLTFYLMLFLIVLKEVIDMPKFCTAKNLLHLLWRTVQNSLNSVLHPICIMNDTYKNINYTVETFSFSPINEIILKDP